MAGLDSLSPPPPSSTSSSSASASSASASSSSSTTTSSSSISSTFSASSISVPPPSISPSSSSSFTSSSSTSSTSSSTAMSTTSTQRQRKMIVEELLIVPRDLHPASGRPRSVPSASDLLSLSLLGDDDPHASLLLLGEPTPFHMRCRSYEEEEVLGPLPRPLAQNPSLASSSASAASSTSASGNNLKSSSAPDVSSSGLAGGERKKSALVRKASLENNPLLDELLELAIVKVRGMIPNCTHAEKDSAHEIGGLGTFMKEMICRSRSALPVVISCLVYLDRCSRVTLNYPDPKFKCPYMLFFVCLVLASKYAHDSTYTNATWATICKKITPAQLCRLELFILKNLDFNLTVSRDDLNAYLNQNFTFGKNSQHLQPASPRPLSPRRWFQFLESS